MRHEYLSVGELEVDNIIGGGVNALSRRIVYLDPTNGSDGAGMAKKIDKAKKTLAAARLRIATGRSDTIILVQGASKLGLSADPLWTENMTNLIGNASPGMVNKRSGIEMLSDYGSPMLTISGYGNLLSNLYTIHGFGATKVALIGTLISGHYNTFRRVHFGGPLNDVLGADAAYRGVNITGINTHFDHCVFGFDTIDRTGANDSVSLGPNTMTTFEDCVFLTRISGTTPHFVEVVNTSGVTRAFFKRCQFIAMATNMATAMAQAFTFTGSSTCAIHLDQECSFLNVTKLALAAQMPYLWLPTVFAATADELNLLAINSASY